TSASAPPLFVAATSVVPSVLRLTKPLGDPLGTPINGGTLGPGGPAAGSTNGFVNLSTDGTTLVAATNNGGADADVIQAFGVATGSLNFATDSAALNAPIMGAGNRFDGAAIDPLTGNIFVTAFGSGLPVVLDPVTGANITDSPSGFFTSAAGTGFRDITFAPNGDIYIRATNGIAGGTRNLDPGQTGDDDFTTFESLGATAGLSGIAGNGGIVQDNFQSAINIEFLPASFTGTEDLVITNLRTTGSDVFADQVVALDANAGFDGVDPFSLNDAGVPVAINFLAADGFSPFTTPDSTSGVYDFSFDPINEALFISDLSNGVIYIFGEQEPESGVDGDYNNDGTVDVADYTVWRDNLNETLTLPNDTTPGAVTVADYTVWKTNFGNFALGAITTVPEPTSAALVGLLSLFAVGRRSR
ncbi:MAG: PEP-CTERM sorting domain-containing protein, partial [Planctomycetota bacterium]